jgi:PKD repeat protein
MKTSTLKNKGIILLITIVSVSILISSSAFGDEPEDRNGGNECPDPPINDSPYDGETNVDIHTTLCVYVYDHDGDDLEVSFYWCDGTLIETITSVSSDSTICSSPLSLDYGTTYYWYATADDGECFGSSRCWEFTTEQLPCQDPVYIDDNFNQGTPGFDIDHYNSKQQALDILSSYGYAYVYDGSYYENIIINNIPCDNTGITQMGEYGCFPTDQSAILHGNEKIYVDDVKIKYMEFMPSIAGSIIVNNDISGTILRCNKFNQNCISDAVGVHAKSGSSVQAKYNWWGVPNGPNGGIMDDSSIADGFGVKIIGNVYVEPWIGIHAEISKPMQTITVESGTPVHFDASGSWAYSFGECCEPELLPLQYQWDFGDKTFSHNMKTSHIYESPGTYNITLMVDAPGIPGLYSNTMFDWDYVTIHVELPPPPLTVSADGENLDGGYETYTQIPIQLFGNADGGTPPYSYSWTINDEIFSIEQNPSYTFDESGTYPVTLNVADTKGKTKSDTTLVTVIQPAILKGELFVSQSEVFIDDIITLTSIVSGGIPPYKYFWTIDELPITAESILIYTFKQEGIYKVSITASDYLYNTVASSIFITVEKKVPADIVDVKGGFGLSTVINTHDQNTIGKITVNGRLWLGGATSYTIQKDTIQEISLPFTYGFGPMDIMITANTASKHYSAFLVGPFFLNLKEI